MGRWGDGWKFTLPQDAQNSQGEFQLYKGGNRGIFHHRVDSQGPSKLLQRTATRLARRPGMDAVLCAAAKDVRVIISASGLAGGIIRTSLLCPTEPMPFCFFLILDPPWMGLCPPFVVQNSVYPKHGRHDEAFEKARRVRSSGYGKASRTKDTIT